jgi:hypothetical protein
MVHGTDSGCNKQPDWSVIDHVDGDWWNGVSVTDRMSLFHHHTRPVRTLPHCPHLLQYPVEHQQNTITPEQGVFKEALWLVRQCKTDRGPEPY